MCDLTPDPYTKFPTPPYLRLGGITSILIIVKSENYASITIEETNKRSSNRFFKENLLVWLVLHSKITGLY